MKIRPDILRTYLSIHTWTGIISGLVLFIAFFAGSMTMFKPQIEQWATPPTESLAQVNITKIDQLIAQSNTQFPESRQGFTVNLEANQSPLSWYEKGGGRGIRLDDNVRHASLDSNGDIITQASGTNELGTLIDQLHRTAGIIGNIGHEDFGVLILGLAAGLYFLALISGVIVLLPTLVKNLFALRSHKGSNRLWLDSHNLVGVVSLPFHLMIAWTAVVFAFHDPFYGGLSVVYGDKPLFEPRTKGEITYSIEQLPSIEEHISQVKAIADGYQIRALEFTQLTSQNPAVAIHLTADDRMQRGGYGDIVYMQPYTFDVQYSTVNQPDNDIFGPIVNSFFSLHFGNFAGNYGRWMYFIMGLLGAFLFYSGNILWLEKRREKQGKQRRSTRIMGGLTIGVCLGSMAGVAVSMLATKWLYLFTQEINQAYLTCYYSVFFLAIAYSLKRGAAIAAIHLLQFLAAVCLLIPVTSLLAHIIPALSHWTTTQLSTGMIELMCCLFAFVFYKASKKAKYRAYFGDPNSIWSITNSSHIDKADNQSLSEKLSHTKI